MSEKAVFDKYANAAFTNTIQLVKLNSLGTAQSNLVLRVAIPGVAEPIFMQAARVEYTGPNQYVWQGKRIDQNGDELPDHMLLIMEGNDMIGEIAVGGDIYHIISVSPNYQALVALLHEHFLFGIKASFVLKIS